MPEYIGHYMVKKEVRLVCDDIQQAAREARDMAWAIDGDKTQMLGVTLATEPYDFAIDRSSYRDPSR